MRFFYRENFYWRIREAHKRKLGKRATLSIGAPLGNLEGVTFIGHSLVTNELGVWKRSISLCGSSVRRTARGDSFTGDPEVKESSGNRHLSLYIGALFRTWKGAHLLRTLRDRRRRVPEICKIRL